MKVLKKGKQGWEDRRPLSQFIKNSFEDTFIVFSVSVN